MCKLEQELGLTHLLSCGLTALCTRLELDSDLTGFDRIIQDLTAKLTGFDERVLAKIRFDILSPPAHQYLYRSFHRRGVSTRATLPSTLQPTLRIIASYHSSDPVCAWTWERTSPSTSQYTFHGHGNVRCGAPPHMWASTGPLSRLPLAACVLGVLSFVRFPGKSNENSLVLVPSRCVCTLAVFWRGIARPPANAHFT